MEWREVGVKERERVNGKGDGSEWQKGRSDQKSEPQPVTEAAQK